MSIPIHPWLILLFLLFVPSIVHAAAPADAWPLARGDALSTGVAGTTLPENPELLWSYEVDHGAFSGTPVIVDGVVYIGDLDGTIYALDLTSGAEVWKVTLDELGFPGSPAVRDGRLFLGDYNGRFYALSCDDGSTLWTFDTRGAIDGGPNFSGENVLIGSEDATLYCLSQATGEEQWRYTIGDQIRCLPTIVEGRVFVAGCDSKLHVIDLADGQSLAEVPIEGPTGNSPAVVEDRIFFGTESGVFYGIDWRAAEVAWTYADPQRGQGIRTAAAVANGLAVVGSGSRKVYACHTGNGELAWSFTAAGRFDSSPVIVPTAGDDPRVYAASYDGRIYGLDLASGEKVWEFEAGDRFKGSPAVADHRLVIASDDGVIYCLGGE